MHTHTTRKCAKIFLQFYRSATNLIGQIHTQKPMDCPYFQLSIQSQIAICVRRTHGKVINKVILVLNPSVFVMDGYQDTISIQVISRYQHRVHTRYAPNDSPARYVKYIALDSSQYRHER